MSDATSRIEEARNRTSQADPVLGAVWFAFNCKRFSVLRHCIALTQCVLFTVSYQLADEARELVVPFIFRL